MIEKSNRNDVLVQMISSCNMVYIVGQAKMTLFPFTLDCIVVDASPSEINSTQPSKCFTEEPGLLTSSTKRKKFKSSGAKCTFTNEYYLKFEKLSCETFKSLGPSSLFSSRKKNRGVLTSDSSHIQ